MKKTFILIGFILISAIGLFAGNLRKLETKSLERVWEISAISVNKDGNAYVVVTEKYLDRNGNVFNINNKEYLLNTQSGKDLVADITQAIENDFAEKTAVSEVQAEIVP